MLGMLEVFGIFNVISVKLRLVSFFIIHIYMFSLGVFKCLVTPLTLEVEVLELVPLACNVQQQQLHQR